MSDVPAAPSGRIDSVGVDVVSISGFAAQLDQPGTRFTSAFTPAEQRAAAADGDGRRAERLAARWAAKEAVVKAWAGTRPGLPTELPDPDLRQIEVRADRWGRPLIRLSGDVARCLSAYDVVVSLTHDGDTAAAVALLRRAPATERSRR